MKPFGIVYKITCTKNDKVYIGITKHSIKRRWSGHRNSSLKGQTKLYRSMRKHGINNFKIEKIDEALDSEALKRLEIHHILHHDSLKSGLNSTKGGDGINGLVHTVESKVKMSIDRLARWKLPEYRKKISESQRLA